MSAWTHCLLFFLSVSWSRRNVASFTDHFLNHTGNTTTIIELPRADLRHFIQNKSNFVYVAKMPKASSSQLVRGLQQLFIDTRVPGCAFGDVAKEAPSKMIKRQKKGCQGFSLATGYWLADHIEMLGSYNVLRITSLREPLRRTLSSLRYAKYKGMVKKGRKPFEEGVEVGSQMRGEKGTVRINNVMTTLLSCRGDDCPGCTGTGGNGMTLNSGPATPENLQDAIFELERSFAIVISEFYDASMCLLKFQLGLFPEEECRYTRCITDAYVNHASGRTLLKVRHRQTIDNSWVRKATNSVPDRVKLRLKPDEYAWIKEQNVLDHVLYLHGVRMLFRRLAVLESETGKVFICK